MKNNIKLKKSEYKDLVEIVEKLKRKAKKELGVTLYPCVKKLDSFEGWERLFKKHETYTTVMPYRFSGEDNNRFWERGRDEFQPNGRYSSPLYTKTLRIDISYNGVFGIHIHRKKK